MLFVSSLLLIAFTDGKMNGWMFLLNFFSNLVRLKDFLGAIIAKSISESVFVSPLASEPNKMMVGFNSLSSSSSNNGESFFPQYILERTMNCLFALFAEKRI